MISKLYQQLQEHIDERQTLSVLRKEIKEEANLLTLKQLMKATPGLLRDLLSSSDAKTRKNAALLMGDLKMDCYAAPLWAAYQKEETRFVKSAYLTALKSYDCTSILDEIKEQLSKLSKMEFTLENKKHMEDEMRALSQLIVYEEGIKRHTFCGYHEKYDCVLLTNRLHKERTEAQIQNGRCFDFPAGVRVITSDIQELLDIRTYSQLFFIVPGMAVCSSIPMEAAKTIAHSKLSTFMDCAHKEPGPFYFRLDIKSKMDLKQKSTFAKKICNELEQLTNRKFINSTSDYECTIRMIETKTGDYNCLLILHTLPDTRFTYRKEHIAASIKPVNAALLVELAKEYMIEDAQVLDPFCGVGTMLIERQMVVKGNTSYGIDTFPEAIEKAKTNTEAAGQIVHYINRNCFDFTHEYKFDEIFTNMPFETAHKDAEEILTIYENFFPMAKRLMTPMGTIIMYTHNINYVHKLARVNGYRIVEETIIHDKEGTVLVILKQYI